MTSHQLSNQRIQCWTNDVQQMNATNTYAATARLNINNQSLPEVSDGELFEIALMLQKEREHH